MNQKQTSNVVKTISTLKSTIGQYQSLALNPVMDIYRGRVVILSPRNFSESLENIQEKLDFILDQVLNPEDDE